MREEGVSEMGKHGFSKWALLAVALLALSLVLACASQPKRAPSNEFFVPITATISKAPKLWEPVTVTCALANRTPFRYLRVEAWIDLVEDPIPPQPVYLDGDVYWEGQLNPGDTATFAAQLAFVKEGIGSARCRVRYLEEGGVQAVETASQTSAFRVGQDSGAFTDAWNTQIVYNAPTNAYPSGGRPLVENSPFVPTTVKEPLLLIINSEEELQQTVKQGLFPLEGKFEWRKVFETNFGTHFLIAVYGPTGPTAGYGADFHEGWLKGNTVILDISFVAPPEGLDAVKRPSTPFVVLWTNRANYPPGAFRFVASQGCVKISGQVTFVKPPDCVEIASTVRDVGGRSLPADLEERWKKGLDEEKAP